MLSHSGKFETMEEQSLASEMDTMKKKKERILRGRRSASKSTPSESDSKDQTVDEGILGIELMCGESAATQELEREGLSIQDTIADTFDHDSDNRNGMMKHFKKFVCAIMVVAIMVILITTCFGLLFVEVARTRAEIASLRKTIYPGLVMQNSDNLNYSITLLYQRLNMSGYFLFNPAASCAALPPSSTSGDYWVRASNGSAVFVYCDMTRSCGGVTGGWMRVAELDMTDNSQQCPSGLVLNNDSNIRTCRRMEESSGCSLSLFSTAAIPYSYSGICGRVIAYQVGTTNAFASVMNRRPPSSSANISGNYVDGVSLTHGNPRQHVWTFAAGLDEVGAVHSASTCPCNSNTIATLPPPFVGEDYFCESGIMNYSMPQFYSHDPLWDGDGCSASNDCCTFNNPPWFYKQLPQPTTDDIEMRVCRDEDSNNEDLAIQMVDIYVR